MTREEYINTLELDIAELREEIKTKDKAYKAIVEELTECAEENEKLKSQLAGTTHCFDEEEHRKLEKENKQLEQVNADLQLQNFNLKTEIMVKKKSLPSQKIKDKTFWKLYDMPTYEELEKENKKIKKQLEKCYCNRTDCSSRIKDSKKYDSLVQTQETQEKAFIKYLEDMLDDENDMFSVVKVKDVLQKYKEIIKN